MQHAWWWVALGTSLVACSGDAKQDSNPDAADADTDADSDTDSDADTDTDTEPAVDADGDGFPADVDCDDGDETVFPGAPDLCGDDRITNCDRTADEGIVTLDGTQGFTDLGAALAAAVADSEILVCPGTYLGNFEATVPVHLVPYGDPAETILDGDSAGTTLAVPAGTQITGLTITGGLTLQSGGGIRLTTSGDLLVQDCVITENRGLVGGGLAIGPDSVATLINTTLENNLGQEGGGGASAGPGSVLDLDATSAISGNTAGLYGGGVFLDNASLVGGVVDGNVTSDYGDIEYYDGVLYADVPWGGAGVAATGTASVTGTEISANVAASGGGGFSLTTGDLTLVDAPVHDNNSYIGGGFSALDGVLHLEGTTEIFASNAYECGGGILILATVIGGTVRDNTADDFGGGLVPWAADIEDTVISGNTANEVGGGMMILGEVNLRNVTIRDNRSSAGGGIGSDRGYYGYEGNLLTIEGGSITGNGGDNGGGLFLVWPTTIDGTLIADNAALIGAGILVDRGATTMSGGSVLRNVATELAGGVYIGGASSSFAAVAVDFGDAADDNVPGDVYAGNAEVVGYGASASFTCDDLGCDPVP